MASNLNVNPLISTDTIHKNGRQIVLTTFHNCITALQQYENKSLEELRHEDYLLGRKYPMNPPVFRSSQVMTANSRSSQNGSYQVKYKSSPGADIKTVENGSFIHFDTFYTSITVMPEYEDKSFEEIRVEDYINGNKYPLVLPVSSSSNHYKTVEPIPIKSEIKNVDKNDDILIDSVCPICLESITTLKMNNIRLMVTTCGHIICKICTTNLLKALPINSKNPTITKTIDCPNCRKKLPQSSIHDLYL